MSLGWYIIYSPYDNFAGIRTAFHQLQLACTVWIPKSKKQKVVRGKLKEKEYPIFPRYVFVKFNFTPFVESLLLDLKAGYFLKYPGASLPVSLTEEELNNIRKAEIGAAPSVNKNFNTSILKGRYVEISSGPFIGFKGRVSSVDSKGNAKVEIVIFGRATLVEITVARLLEAVDPEGNLNGTKEEKKNGASN